MERWRKGLINEQRIQQKREGTVVVKFLDDNKTAATKIQKAKLLCSSKILPQKL